MLTFQQRRDTILSQFAQAKADLETLNSDIDAEIEKNKSVISTLTSKNTELASLSCLTFFLLFASRVEYAAYAPRR